MRFHFYSPRSLDPFDWRTPDEQGIGNSETSHVEMALRLARRGHQVTSYTRLPRPRGSDDMYGGVHWCELEVANFMQSGVWVIYRSPEDIDHFADDHPHQQIWLMNQDTYYIGVEGREAKIDVALVLSEGQKAAVIAKAPKLEPILNVTSNGLRVDMIAEVVAAGMPERNPHRLHFSSSPDRGLKVLLEHIYPRAKEYVPDLMLHIYYGWNNIETLMATGSEEAQAAAKRFFGPNMEETKKLMQQPGVTWHGRIGQRDLTGEWLKAGLWVFPSMYPESSCATCMEAQALGAIPICQSIWALGENVRYGSVLSGDSYGDPLTIARFTAELVRWSDPTLQASVRPAMMQWAWQQFDWERFVTQWEDLARANVSERAHAVA